jgi:aspartate racemase
MSKHIGIVACSAEGAALCYRTICQEAPAVMGQYNHPEITMHTFPLEQYMVHVRAGDWREVGCPDNTIHQAMPHVLPGSPIPWIHIAQAVGEEALRRGFGRLGIIGTDYLMTGPVYPDTFGKLGLECVTPREDERREIDRIIFAQLVNGVCLEASRLFFNDAIAGLKARGCDAVVLGCTEIPLLVNPDDCPLPTLDSTRLLARAAIKEANAR